MEASSSSACPTSSAHPPWLLCRCCQVYGQDNDVAIVLLKFFADFVQNRSQRISFEPNSPNGIGEGGRGESGVWGA